VRRARKDPARGSRYALRWLRRLLDETDELTIGEVLAASALAALGRRDTTTRSRP
jgi:hypothetical protein